MRAVLAGLAMLLAGPAAAQDFVVFRSPTGNIHCLMPEREGDWQGVRCDILEAEISYPLRPADCELDWGHAFEVPGQGSAGLACAGDTVATPDSPVLDYGRQITHAGVTCTSEKTGMTCVNRDGHGFSLSRARQRLF